MKRTLSFWTVGSTPLVAAGTALVAATYGMVRLAYGLFLPDVQHSTGMTDGTAGVVASVSSLAYCLGALAGLAGAPARRLVGGACWTAAGGSLGMAAAPDVVWLAPSAVVASAGAGLASPGLVVLVERHVAGPRAAGAQATVNAGTGPGLVAAGVMALLLLPHWRLGFTLSAVVTTLAGVAVLLLDGGASDPGSDRDAGDAPRGVLPGVCRSIPWRALAVPIASSLLLGAGSAAVWTYGRSHLVAAGADATASVVTWVAIGLGGAGCVATARRLGALPPAVQWSLTAGAVALATLVIGWAPGRTVVVLTAGLLFGWGFVAATSALIAWSAVVSPAGASRGTALLFILLVLGQAVGAPVVAVVDGVLGAVAGFAVAAGLATGAALLGVVGAGVSLARPAGEWRHSSGRRGRSRCRPRVTGS